MDKRDANQGVCDNSCREKYKIHEREFVIEDISNEEAKMYEIDEDEHGTYILNAKDLCMIEHLQALRDAGVISFKVEGRTKSEFYAAMVARSYRGALDDLQAGRAFNPNWLAELNKLTHRGYHTAFMLADPSAEGQNYQASTQYNSQFKFVGYVNDNPSADEVIVEVKNKIQLGQKLEVISPNGKTGLVTVDKITSLLCVEKQAVHSGSGAFRLKLNGATSIEKSSLLVFHENT